VSELAEGLHVISKDSNRTDEDTTDITKQDENILKVFNLGSASETHFSDVLVLIAGSLAIAGLYIGAVVFVIQTTVNATYTLRSTAPHLDSIMGAYTMNLGSLLALHRLLLGFSSTPVPLDNGTYPVQRVYELLERGRAFYILTSFGGSSGWQVPYSGLHNVLQQVKSVQNCERGLSASFVSSFECFAPDMGFAAIHRTCTMALAPQISTMTATRMPMRTLPNSETPS
jgi:hypothetical protein